MIIGMRNKVFAVLDLGSREIIAIAAEWGKNGDYVFKEFLVCPSKGMPNGVVKDMAQAADSISNVVSKLSKKVGKKIHEVHVTVSSSSVELVPSHGMILLSKYGREILPRDVDKCMRVGAVVRAPSGKESLHRMVREFSVDSSSGIKKPVGLEGLKMGVTMTVLVIDISVMRNLKKCIALAGYNTGEIVFSGIAASHRAVPENSKEDGVCFVNIRGDLTETMIFRQGSLLDCRVLPFGAGKNMLQKEGADPGGMRELSAILHSMDGWGEVETVIISGESEVNEDVFTELCSGTGRDISHGTCFSRPLEYLPTDRVRYVGCLGILDHIQMAKRSRRGEANPLKWFFSRFISFMDRYF